MSNSEYEPELPTSLEPPLPPTVPLEWMEQVEQPEAREPATPEPSPSFIIPHVEVGSDLGAEEEEYDTTPAAAELPPHVALAAGGITLEQVPVEIDPPAAEAPEIAREPATPEPEIKPVSKPEPAPEPVEPIEAPRPFEPVKVIEPERVQLPPRPRDAIRVQPYPKLYEPQLAESNIPMPEGYVNVGAVLTDAVTELNKLDPELLADPDTEVGRITELAVEGLVDVTVKYGTPEKPLWANHPYGHEPDYVLMTYHNGGKRGHTSLDAEGAGVPRGSLLIDHAINRVVGEEIRTSQDRAEGLKAGVDHDKVQLCGRTLLPEGQGNPHRGDERISAEQSKDELVAEGVSEAAADRIARRILATAFNPDIGGQNVDYSRWHENRNDPEALKDILGQEVTAAADLLGTTGRRGELGAWEYTMETLTMKMKGNITEERLQARGVDPLSIQTPDAMIAFIARDKPLREAFIEGMQGQVGFFRGFKFSDEAIRTVTDGRGIDQLFPGRNTNAIIMQRNLDVFRAARRQEDRMAIWRHVRSLAGYR